LLNKEEVYIMRRDYTEIGQKEGYTKEIVDKGIASIDAWIDTTKGSTSLPMSQGMAIKEVIKELRIPKVSRVAIHGAICGAEGMYGLYGIHAEYKAEFVTIYIADNGCEVIPVAMDVEDKAVQNGR
jgi:hypothetical protein